MGKIKLRSFLIITLIFLGIFSLVFISNKKVSAQVVKDTIKVETTGYSMLGESSFVFGGYYSGNLDKKGFTTYFEFKRNASNLNDPADREKTIVIKRYPNADEYGYFYTSPELQLFSDYYFRAVGCFEENSDKNDDCSKHDSTLKYYGETLHMRTGYIPINTMNSSGVSTLSWEVVTYGDFSPFTVTKNNEVMDYNIPNVCDFLGSLLYKVCDTKTSPPAPKPLDPKKLIYKLPTPTPSNSTAPKDFSGGLVPCDGSATNPCEFNQLLKLINDVISFVFTNLILPFAAIMFAYAGFELITSGGETSKREKAKKIFTNVAVGLIIAAAAFLIVKTILLITGANTGWNWFGFFK